MKCNRIAVYGWKLNGSVDKSKPRILYSFSNLKDIEEYKKQIKHLYSHHQPCEGEIESQIELEYIPYMGGSDANIEVRFKCKKCQYEYAGDNGLPYDINSLNKFLTDVIEKP
jgi:hypothetical protein